MAKQTTTAKITGTSTGKVTEAGAGKLGLASAGGDLNAFDSFGTSTTFNTPTNLIGIYGTFTFDASTGAWSYLLDNTRSVTNALAAGQSVQDKLTITSLSNVTRDIVVTVTGSNDAPVVTAGAPSATLVEAGTDIVGAATATITMTKVDPDAGDSASWNMTNWTLVTGSIYSKAGIYGSARFDTGTGVVSYTLDNSMAVTDALSSGSQVFDTFAITAKDKKGIATSANAVFKIQGSDDGVVDTTPPAALPLSLANDTGSLPDDEITSDGTLSFLPDSPEDGAQVEYNVTNSASGWSLIAPTPEVGPNTVYVRQTDVAGNVSEVSSLTYTFDNDAPTLTSSNPTDGDTSIAVSSNIVLTFSENVSKGSGYIILSNGGDTYNIAITDPGITISNNIVTINPTADLSQNTSYWVTMASGTLTDTAGNIFAGIVDDEGSHALNFTTAEFNSIVGNSRPNTLTGTPVNDLIQGRWQ